MTKFSWLKINQDDQNIDNLGSYGNVAEPLMDWFQLLQKQKSFVFIAYESLL